MPERRRWTPVRGTASRIADPLERLLVGVLDAPGRILFGAAQLLRRRDILDPASVRQVLVLRLDRMGDVLMSLPALADLRRALPRAFIRLAVGRWSEEIARSAPVDETLVWSAPWVGRADEGAETLSQLVRKARAMRPVGLDLALDLQGDIRASLLMRLTGAAFRAGYANTGGAYLLNRVVPLDETVSWVEQNRRAVGACVGPPAEAPRVDPLTQAEKDFARRLVATLGILDKRPLVGLHPSGGRRVKQWDVSRWREVARALQRDFAATVLVTGSEADRPLAASLAEGLDRRPLDLTGRLRVRETLALVSALDLFLSPDTGPMHMACAVGTPSVSVFGPSDPVRYFSGGAPLPRPVSGERHLVVRPDLWCSPCNLIRNPPRECSGPGMPECLALVGVEEVRSAAATLLGAGGFRRRSGGAE